MQTLLSEHWHAVRFLRPRLRDGVQPLHRVLRGRGWVLLLDPVTQRFHRMTPAVWRVLQLLDGRRTLDQVWDAACTVPADVVVVGGAGAADAAPPAPISQHELVQLMASLHANDLLQTQVSPDADEVFERYQRQARAKLKQSLLNPLSLRLPLLHPDAWFQRHAPLARAVMSWPVGVLWLMLVAPAGVLAWQHWAQLTENLSDRVLAASNVVLLWFTYPLVKAVHEWAHGLAVKAFGGTVREIGLMFVVFTPVPYVDATSSYRFPSKWARALVAAAGIMAELLLGALALYVWLLAESGLVTAVAFNVVLIAGASTLLVNGNPLMRYDGYFILCDVLETPNLGQRATQYITYLIDRYAFGARDARPPQQAEGERWLLALYGAVSPFYRLSITFGLIWFVASEYLLVGAVMALMAAWSALVLPLWKGWKHLRQAPSLARRRRPALRRTVIALALLVGLVGVLPLPFNTVHQAVVWVPDEALVRADAAGLVARALKRPGDAVAAGEPVALLDNPQLVADLGTAAAAVAQTESQLRRAETDALAQVDTLRGELAARRARLADAQARVAGLTLRAGVAGHWLPKTETELAGRHARRGEVLGYVVNGPSATVRAAVTQDDMDLVRGRLHGVQVRLVHGPAQTLDAQLLRQVPGGEFELVSPALGSSSGGEIAVDPAKPGGTTATQRVFDVELRLAAPSTVATFGERAWVRFDLGHAPLAWQGFVRLRQTFLARLHV
jgi:putative peptide zinc metalloprotease protein